jgi:hypothetical protein
MFEWSVKSDVTIKARVKDVWALWSDVGSWPIWSQDVEWSKLDGLFLVGSKGTIKPKDWPASTFTITQIEEGKNFTTESFLPKIKMNFSYKMSTEGDLVHLIHRITVSGLLAPILWLMLRNKMKKSLEKNIKNLATRVER